MRVAGFILSTILLTISAFTGAVGAYANEVSRGEYTSKKRTEPVIAESMLRFKLKDGESQLNTDFIRLISGVRDAAISRKINDIDYINAKTDLKVLPLQEVNFPSAPYSRAQGFGFSSPLVSQYYQAAKSRFSIEYFRNDENGRIDFLMKGISDVTCITASELKEKMPWLKFNMYRGVGLMHGPPDYDDRYVFSVEDSSDPYRIAFWISFNHQSPSQPMVTCLSSFGVNEAGSRPNFFVSHFNF